MAVRPAGGYTENYLQTLDARDLVSTFVAVHARQWQRRVVNRILPKVTAAMLEAQLKGDSPDMAGILRQVWLEEDLITLLLGTDE